MTIGQSIRKLRTDEGYTQVAFAQVLGVSCSAMSRFEADKLKVSLRRLKQIADVTNRWLILKSDGKTENCSFTIKESVRTITFDQKLQDCYNPLLRYCRKHLTRSEDSAKELTQETLYRALKVHYTLQPEISMLTWLIGIAKKTALKKASKLVYVDEYIETSVITDEIESFFRENHELFKAVEKLPERRRRIYELSAIGCSYSDIAREMSTTENAIKTTMGQIKNKLKTCMA